MKPVVRMQVFALVLILIIFISASVYASFGTANASHTEMAIGTEIIIALIFLAAAVLLGASIKSDVALLLWYEGKKKGRHS